MPYVSSGHGMHAVGKPACCAHDRWVASKRTKKRSAEDQAYLDALGRRIEEAWRQAGYTTARQFAEDAGVEYNALIRWQRGHVEPKSRHLAAIARTADVTMYALVHGVDAPEPRHHAWIEFLSSQRDIEPHERRTLATLRFFGLEPSAGAYVMMLSALRYEELRRVRTGS